MVWNFDQKKLLSGRDIEEEIEWIHRDWFKNVENNASDESNDVHFTDFQESEYVPPETALVNRNQVEKYVSQTKKVE